jgi:hypothetical protein
VCACFLSNDVVARKRAAELQYPPARLLAVDSSFSGAMAQKNRSFLLLPLFPSISPFPRLHSRTHFCEHQPRKENMSSIVANVRCRRKKKTLDASKFPRKKKKREKLENKIRRRHIVSVFNAASSCRADMHKIKGQSQENKICWK